MTYKEQLLKVIEELPNEKAKLALKLIRGLKIEEKGWVRLRKRYRLKGGTPLSQFVLEERKRNIK
jgi:hypothetical protein